MKKGIAVLVAVLMLLCVFPASGFADAPDEPDEAAAIALIHQIYEANQLDALLGRHESLSYSLTYPEAPGQNFFFWETRDCVYMAGTSGAMFFRDRVLYRMTCDEETGALDVFGGVNTDPDYNPFFNVVPETEEDFFDPAHEKIIQIREEGSVLHLVSAFDEEQSREIIEEIPEQEYTGQLVRTEIIFDAETCELVEHIYTAVQDGKEVTLSVIDAAYDQAEPMGSRALRADFERAAENTMTVSFIVDPGTDHEFSRQLTVPVNMNADTLFSASPVVFFSDPNGETLERWDRMSDHTLYVFTNPDEELIEKFQPLYKSALRTPQSAGPDAGMFQKYIDANTGSEILTRHTNLRVIHSYVEDGEAVDTAANYRDADSFLSYQSSGHAMLQQAKRYAEKRLMGDQLVCMEIIFDTEEAYRSYFERNRDAALLLFPEGETLLESSYTDDGQFAAVTEIRDAESVRQALETLGGPAYAEGMFLRCEHIFDAQTCDLLSVDTFLIDPEGEERPLWQDRCIYDAEPYDFLAEGEPFAEYFAALADPALSRTISVTFEPDTENERVTICETANSARFYIFYNGHYAEDIYTDRACTQLFEGSDGVSDLELFVK